MNRINEKINALVESIQNKLTATNPVYSVVFCKQHNISVNNVLLVPVTCELCSKTRNITSRSLPKVISAASQVAKELQKTLHDKATTNGGDVTKGRMLSVRKKDDGNTVAIIVLKHLITKEEIESLRSIHEDFSIAFTAVHLTKHAGEKTRTIEGLKTAKKKEQATKLATV